ncbi:alpha/beta fold hydrolase [Kitasatospora sp. NPDC051853]|uniref:alpha/beta fold hydrolase n=1 Tax=Kitasatospora sp. NPDC051853 TaxID=3364058 RepID=UPI00379CD659
MATFSAPDGTLLTYHREGSGAPLLCLPGGPMRDSACLGDLGGLAAHRTLHRLDLRGTGDSAEPADPETYRVDHQVEDVEAFRVALGLERVDLLAHSAGSDLAVLYAARYPERIARLVLVTPAAAAVDVPFTVEDRTRAAAQLADEPWYPQAAAALEATKRGVFDFEAFAPLIYGRWGVAEQEHVAERAGQTHPEAAQYYYQEEAFDPAATRAALASLEAPVLVVAGEFDGGPSPARAAEITAAFPKGEHVVLPGVGHFPWIGEPAPFLAAVREFLDR